MAFIEQKAKAAGFRALRLDAYSGNPRAMRFYAGLAYEFTGFVPLRKGQFACYEKMLNSD